MKLRQWAVLLAASLPATAQNPIAQHIAARVTSNELKADVSFLASDALEGRGTPSRGLDVAAEFIAAQFRRAGLEPVGDDGYFQTAPFLSVTPNAEGLRLTLEIAGKTVDAAANSLAISQPVAADLQHAPAYLVTRTGIDDAAPDAVRGKALIVDATEGVPRIRPAVLARLAPKLVVLLAGERARAMLRSGPQLRESSSAGIPTLIVMDKAFQAALADLKAGPLDATISAHIGEPKPEPVKLRNVVGLLRGSDAALKDTYILLTAHYDHLGIRGTASDRIYNGANDDASGTASVIEIANALSSLPARPKRSIVFIALFGEEAGLLGSRYYARHAIFPIAKTVADLNLEQMGRPDDTSGPRIGVLNATGFDYTDITGSLGKAGEEFGIKLVKDEQNSDPFFARSDNQAFADEGVPSHTLSVGYVFAEYHQPGDEWQKIDYENMAKVDQTVALGVYRIADSAEVPKWNTENPKTEPYRKAR